VPFSFGVGIDGPQNFVPVNSTVDSYQLILFISKSCLHLNICDSCGMKDPRQYADIKGKHARDRSQIEAAILIEIDQAHFEDSGQFIR